jgi:hypothetical protein
MAKKKSLEKEVKEVKSVIVEASELAEAPIVVEVDAIAVDAPLDITVANADSTPTGKIEVVEVIKEVQYSVYPDNELVIFRNNKGHLKWGNYKSISNLGYLAIGTYAEYKQGKTF